MPDPKCMVNVSGKCLNVISGVADVSATDSAAEQVEALSVGERHLQKLYECVTDGVMIVGRDYIIREVNDRTCELSGYKREELLGKSCGLICPGVAEDNCCPVWAQDKSEFCGLETVIRCKDGTLSHVLKSASRLIIDDEEYICENFSDISALKEVEFKLRKSNNELKIILESAPIGIILVRNYRIIESNRQLADLLGYTPEEMLGMDVRTFCPDADKISAVICGKDFKLFTKELTVRHHDGSEVVVIVTVNTFGKDEVGDSADVLVTMLDITERQKAREEIWRQAYYDKLTEIPNRAYLLKELQRNIEQNNEISLILFDLNKFKEVNDNYGHLAGDTLLQNVARSLSDFIQKPNFTGRLGGDEFIIIVHNRDREELEAFCASICDIIATRCELQDQSIRVSASLGIVSNADNVNDYLLRADLAMYEAKMMSKMRPNGAYKFFTPSMLKSHEIQSQMKNMLLEAFDNDEFDIAYQPVYNIKTMTIEGVEALLRWEHPTYGEVAPEVVVPIADETGVLVLIGHWVLDQVGRTLSSLQQLVPALRETGFYISVNMTLQQLSDPDLISVFTQMLEKYSIPGDIIMIDITDTSALDKSKWSLSIINHLKEYGVRISIDDFGIGYSALSTVERSSINILKIDRSYISKLHIEKNMEITKAIINLAKALDLGVVAEGVETLEQFKMVSELQCDAAQGYYLNKPLNVDQLRELTYNLYM